MSTKKSNDTVGNWTRNLPSIPVTLLNLQRAFHLFNLNVWDVCNAYYLVVDKGLRWCNLWPMYLHTPCGSVSYLWLVLMKNTGFVFHKKKPYFGMASKCVYSWVHGPCFRVCKTLRLKQLNPLKTKDRLLYLKTQSVPRCKHFSSRL